VLLKGAHSVLATPDGQLYFNSTGNAGMATAGSGDVLTGIITSFLAQGKSPKLAALAGMYVHGLAGDIAAETFGQHALIASDIIDHLGDAMLNTFSFEA
ncbi:MAG: NAD(P)H-hydrate dehydratase, partial [Salibacteraceae bacterium]|nr:NAD(P)H-hydrate dehydratase [Salibacteraceae bacterium]